LFLHKNFDNQSQSLIQGNRDSGDVLTHFNITLALEHQAFHVLQMSEVSKCCNYPL